MSAAVAIGALTAAGVFLILQRGIVRIAVGLVLLQHGINLLLVISGGRARRGVPIGTVDAATADPVGQAFALTAIVISLGTTIFLLAIAFRRARTEPEEDAGDVEAGS